jgi:hypothetical protein
MRRLGLLAVLALAGCGGSGSHSAVQTVAKYGAYPAQTIAREPGGPTVCRKDAAIVARDAKAFYLHSTTTGAYPADLYYTIIREAFADFEARGCAASYLRGPLHARLSTGQLQTLIADLPATLAEIVRAGLRS